MEIKNHTLISAEQVASPNADNRPDANDISLIVIHCISLPEGCFDTAHIKQLFCNQLKAEDSSDLQQLQSHIKQSATKDRGSIKPASSSSLDYIDRDSPFFLR
jgi:N-acetyl-anhydromuramyl-L-alanine amidase AmpD